jgi:transketolase
VGIAIAGQHLDKLPYRMWVLCGDSEMAEGSMWDALDKAAWFRLANLTVLVDVNGLGMRGPTELGWDLERYAQRVAAFGCHPVTVENGHDVAAIDAALAEAVRSGRAAVVGAHAQGTRVC